jgi:hypothetical protein
MQFNPPATDTHGSWQRLGLSDMLCGACQRLFSGKSERLAPQSSKYYHHKTPESFFEAVSGYCRLCYRLWSDVRSENAESARVLECSSVDVRFLFLDWFVDRSHVFELQLEFVVHSTPAGAMQQGICTDFRDLDTQRPLWTRTLSLIPIDEDTALHDLVSCRDLEDRTDAPNALALAEKWLLDCLVNHPQCSVAAANASRFRPARLIDVGARGLRTVRLIDTSTLPASFHADYTTLSHRWGSGVPTRLTKETHHQLLRGVSVNTLPQTFRDARCLIRHLKIRYIWIDSLCIFQDSIEDWLQQGSEMYRIYEHGVLNIAATASSDSTCGIYRIRDNRLIQTLVAVMPWGVYGTKFRGYQKGQVQVFRCLDKELRNQNIDCATLNSRAWVLQERALSPRKLHCGQRQLFWECRSKVACEECPNGFLDPLETNLKNVIPLLDRLNTGPFNEARRDSGQLAPAASFLTPAARHECCLTVYMNWYKTVGFYSTCGITKEDDKLIAISGLAKKIEMILPDQYLAGLFQGDIHVGLMWRCDWNDGSQEIQQYQRLGAWHSRSAWRAPSWSWASMKGRVKWDDFRLSAGENINVQAPLLQLLDASIVNVGFDRTGQLSAANITVEAPVIELRGQLGTCVHTWESTIWENSHRLDCCRRKLSYTHLDTDHQVNAQFDEPAIITLLSDSKTSQSVVIPAIPVNIALHIPSSFPECLWVSVQGLLLHEFTDRIPQCNAMERIGRFEFVVVGSVVSYSSFLRYFQSGTSRHQTLLF